MVHQIVKKLISIIKKKEVKKKNKMEFFKLLFLKQFLLVTLIKIKMDRF
jgi:hypothetical protein